MPQLLKPGGKALICLNAPELGVDFLTSLVESSSPKLRFVERLENPSTFPCADINRALKVLIFELIDENVNNGISEVDT